MKATERRAQRWLGEPRSVTVTSTVSGVSACASVWNGVRTVIELLVGVPRIVACVPPKSPRSTEALVGKPAPVVVTLVPPWGWPEFGVMLEMKKLASVLQAPPPPPPPVPRYVNGTGEVADCCET